MSEINPLKPEFPLNFRGVLTAPAQAFALKKIFLGALTLVAALVVYDIFVYLALWYEGLSLSFVYRSVGFFPVEKFNLNSLVSRLIAIAGLMAALGTFGIGCLAINVINVEELRGNKLCSARDGLRFALSRARQALLAWLTVGLFLIFLGACLAALGALPRLPWIGDILFAVFLVIPGFLFGLVFAFTLFAFGCSFLVLPAAAAADRVGETFTSLLETFSTVMRRPFRWLGYTAYGAGAAKFCSWILAVFSFYALEFLLKFGGLFGGKDTAQTFGVGAALLPLKGELARYTTHLWPGIDLPLFGDPGVSVSDWGSGGGKTVATYLIAAALIVVFLYIWGYAVSIIATTQTYAYVALRKLRDDYDITAEDPLFIEREWINPPIEESDRQEREILAARDATDSDDDKDRMHDGEW